MPHIYPNTRIGHQMIYRWIITLVCLALPVTAAPPSVSSLATPVALSLAQGKEALELVVEHFEAAQEAARSSRIDKVLHHLQRGLAPRDSSAGYHQARLELWGLGWRRNKVTFLLKQAKVDDARELFDRSLDVLNSSFAGHHAEGLRKVVEAAERKLAQDSSRDARSQQVDRRLQSARRSLDRADALLAASQLNSHRTVFAARQGQSALRRYQSIERTVTRWIEDYGDDIRHATLLREVGRRAELGTVRSMLRIANARTAQGDFREALQWVGRVKLLEPGNRLAQELERTIQLAIASSNMEIGDVTPANLR